MDFFSIIFSFNFDQPGLEYREFREQSINLLKHRILVFLYRRAIYYREGEDKGNAIELRKFYQHFDQVRSPDFTQVNASMQFPPLPIRGRCLPALGSCLCKD